MIYRSSRTVNKHRVPTTRSKVYLQLPLIRLDRSRDKRDVRWDIAQAHRPYNDDDALGNGGGYLLFNYFVITGSCATRVF